MRKRFLALFCAALLVFLCGCGNSQSKSAYNEAEALFESGDFQAAALKFEECGEYKDSGERVIESKYQYARSLLEAGRLKEAKEEFSALGEYKDCSDMLLECDYQEAAELLSRGNYKNAQSAFERLGNYKDSETMILECKYQEALYAIQRKEYSNAKSKFESLGDYKDSSELVNEAVYLDALSKLEKEDYTQAYNKFLTIKDYKDVSDYLARFYKERRLSSISVKQVDNFGNSSVYTEKYEYDGNGHLTKRYSTSLLSGTSFLIHAWAEQPYPPALANTEKYEYDTEGRIVKITGLSGSAQNYLSGFEYNDQGQIVKETIKTGTDNGEMTLSYNNKGQLIRVQSDSTHGFVITYTYDSKDNVLTTYNSVDFGYSYTHNYKYEDDKIIEDTVRTNFGGNYHDVYSYNSFGEVETIDRDYDNRNIIDPTITYTYKEFTFYLQ